MQQLLTILILVIAVSYAAHRIYRLLSGKKDPCADCQMKKNCQKFCDKKDF